MSKKWHRHMPNAKDNTVAC